MKEIELTQGKVALVDDDDYEELSNYNWFAQKSVDVYYAATNCRDNDGVRRTLQMHRYLCDSPERMEVDHINGNTLDNRKSNLRVCTKRENTYNKHKRTPTNSIYRGITKEKECDRWRAQIFKDGIRYYLGLYKTEIEAARAYNKKARELFGEFASINEGI